MDLKEVIRQAYLSGVNDKDSSSILLAESYAQSTIDNLTTSIIHKVEPTVCVDYDNFTECRTWEKLKEGCTNCKLNPRRSE